MVAPTRGRASSATETHAACRVLLAHGKSEARRGVGADTSRFRISLERRDRGSPCFLSRKKVSARTRGGDATTGASAASTPSRAVAELKSRRSAQARCVRRRTHETVSGGASTCTTSIALSANKRSMDHVVLRTSQMSCVFDIAAMRSSLMSIDSSGRPARPPHRR